jgi:hypothetical protein
MSYDPKSKSTTKHGFDPNGARVVGHNLASSTADLIMRMEELGFSFGSTGAVMNPELVPALEGLFTVLAGGKIEVHVLQRGNPDIVAELHNRVENSVAESNTINSKLDFYLTISA